MNRSGKYIYKSQSGFTLLEVLVVMIIFSVISVLSFQGFVSLVDADERSKQQVKDQNRIQQTWAVLLNDFMQMVPRPPRDVLGKHQPAYQVNLADYKVRFSRAGLTPYGRQGGLQLIAFSVNREGELLRWVWPVLDDAPANKPTSQVLMNDVVSLQVEQLNLVGEYEPNWPPLNVYMALDALPSMIKISLTTREGFNFERVIPGVSRLDLATNDNEAKANRFPPIDEQKPSGDSLF